MDLTVQAHPGDAPAEPAARAFDRVGVVADDAGGAVGRRQLGQRAGVDASGRRGAPVEVLDDGIDGAGGVAVRRTQRGDTYDHGRAPENGLGLTRFGGQPDYAA